MNRLYFSTCRRRLLDLPMVLAWVVAASSGAFAQGHWLGPDDQPPPQRAAEGIGPRSESEPIVRMAYLIPSNRVAQVDGAASFRQAMLLARDWYRDQMVAHGQGVRTFRMEMEGDGVTPLIHVTNVAVTDSYLRGDIFGRTIDAAIAAGIPVWSVGQLWVLIPETHFQNANGEVTGGAALGASFGSGSDPGVALLGSDGLVRFKYLTDDRSYAGLTVPELGPYPLVQDVSFFWFEGTTLSSVSSSAIGALMHEMGHAFGLPHDFRNDANFYGNLMGNGLRGVRANFYPARYPIDLSWLSTSAAKVLGVSRYFGGSSAENVRPALTIHTSGSTAIASGLLKIDFTTSDASGLVAAFLHFNGDRVGEMALSGTAFSGSFMTPYYAPGVAGTFEISVYDVHANKQSVISTITPTGAGNRAPQAHFKVSRNIGFTGETLNLNASASSDPDGAVVLNYEWDFNGDGTFDTSPSSTSSSSLMLPGPDNRKIQVRVTDPASAQSSSAPLFVEFHRPAMNLQLNPPGTAAVDWMTRLGIVYQPSRSYDLVDWDSLFAPALHGNGGSASFADPVGAQNARFYRADMTRRLAP